MANPGFPPQPMPPQGMPNMPRPQGPGIPMAGTLKKGTPKIVPVVVSAGLAVGVFCGLYFGLGTGEPNEAEADSHGKSSAPTGPQSAAGASGERSNFKSADKPPSELKGSGAEPGSAIAPGSGATPGSATAPGTGSGATPPGTGSGATPATTPGEIAVALTFTLTPPTATITIDGEPVTDSKATIKFTGDKKTVRLVAKASGFKTYDKKITVTKEMAEEAIEIKLGKRGSGGTRPHGGDTNDRDPPGGLIDL